MKKNFCGIYIVVHIFEEWRIENMLVNYLPKYVASLPEWNFRRGEANCRQEKLKKLFFLDFPHKK